MARRLEIRITGEVQGVGFRPYVARLARELRLGGSVRNDGWGVAVEATGEPAALDALLSGLRRGPAAARVEALEVAELGGGERAGSFEIEASAEGTAAIALPPDLACCADCRAEIADPGDRRFDHAFASCTACGPRWTILRGLPYDRARTTMSGFPLCAACAAEYSDPADRRYHAQPIACPDCGPTLTLGEARGGAALDAAAARLAAGEVVALKGLGGYQLLADARDRAAIAELRRRKRRPRKPLALLVADLSAAEALVSLDAVARRALTSPAGPIVLAPRREGAALADGVAPGLGELGLMLPTTPLHARLLARCAGPLVCTSANRSGEPLAIRREQLAGLEAGGGEPLAVLDHDRPIARAADDSVVRGEQLLRRARGLAPRALPLPDGPAVLAVGCQQKVSVALAVGPRALVGVELGELASSRAVERHRDALRELLELSGASPERIACDLHPELASTRAAEALAAELGLPLVRVQHHVAHLAAVAAEHRLREPLLGLVWDGTGHGADGSSWGGEAIALDPATGDWRRAARLRAIRLPGGEAAIRDPRRTALALLAAIGESVEQTPEARRWFEPGLRRGLAQLLERDLRCPPASSVGRLFDGVAALAGLCENGTSYSAQAACELEAACAAGAAPAYPLPLVEGVADWAPLVRGVVADARAGRPVGEIAARFHAALIELALAMSEGAPRVALAGGCFANARLLAGARAALEARGAQVLAPRQLPAGDGAIAYGQCALARLA